MPSRSRPYPAPPAATARRLGWPFLPRALRAEIEERLGAPVVDAVSQGAGFTPGFASVLTCADGTRHFVKAASVAAQRMFADSYREEARKLSALPEDVPAPRLRWLIDGDWVVLGIDHVEASNPSRPWRRADLDACLDACEQIAAALTPAPEALELAAFEDELAAWPAYWDQLRATRPDLTHLDEAAALAASFAPAVGGDTVVHTDLRADNFLIDPDGRAWVCDWNWPTRGAAWLDSLMTLLGPRGDGLDVARDLAERPLLRDVPADHLDAALALVTGYFLHQADQPVPPTSPHLREHQRWQGEVCWDWLCERRAW